MSNVAVDTDPADLLSLPVAHVHSLERTEVEAFQVAAAARRFTELRTRIPLLERIARELGIDEIRTLDDVVPLLFRPDVFKSYPLHLLTKPDFGALTAWLDRLSAVDLSGVDTSACMSITSWMDELERQTPLRVGHSSGTGGVVTLMPYSDVEIERLLQCWYFFYQGIGDEPSFDLAAGETPLVFLHYQHGWGPVQRRLRLHHERVPQAEKICYALYTHPWDPDLISLQGRITAAEQAGLELAVSADMRERLANADQLRLEAIPKFVDRIAAVKGQRCVGHGTWSEMLAAGMEAERRGLRAMFDPRSGINPGGGFKGGFAGAFSTVPDDWYEQICRFLGQDELFFGYGMSESTAHIRSCAQHRYHIPPFVLAWVLDPVDGTPLPRTGVQTGRYAFLDLLPERYWGGIVTADSVRIHWDEKCPCGRSAPFLDDKVTRIAGGVATATRTAAVHQDAIGWLGAGL